MKKILITRIIELDIDYFAELLFEKIMKFIVKSEVRNLQYKANKLSLFRTV